MPKRECRYDDFIGIPIEKELKRQIAVIAKGDERSPTEMARILLREAVSARRGQHRRRELATA